MKSKHELEAMVIDEVEREFRRELIRDMFWIFPLILLLLIPMGALLIPVSATPGLLVFTIAITAMVMGWLGFEYAR